MRAVKTSDGPIICDKVVLAAGIWSRQIGALAGVAPRIVHTKTSPIEQGGLMLIATGEGIFPSVSSKFTQPHAAKGVAELTLADPKAKIPVMLSWRSDECSPAVLEFVAAARQAFPQLRKAGNEAMGHEHDGHNEDSPQQQIPALDIQRLAPQFLIARDAPNVGCHLIAVGQYLLSFQGLPQN